MSNRRVVLLAMVAVAVSALVTTAWASGLTITTKSLGANRRAAPVFFPNTVSTATCTDLLICTLGGVAGSASNGDTVSVVFSAVMDQGTLCSAWAGGNTTNRSITVTATINNNTGSTGNDTLTVTAVSGVTCTVGFKFGTIDLGSAGYVGAAINYTSTTFTLTNAGTTPTFGLKLNGGSQGNSVASSVITYSCDAALASSTSVLCGQNKSVSAAVQQF